jgi:hypothetical protein
MENIINKKTLTVALCAVFACCSANAKLQEQSARTSFGPGNYSIVSEEYRYIHYNDGSEEFYDRTKDAHEWNNVITNPEYAAMVANHRAQIPQERHEILGQNSTGHKSFDASEAFSRGEPIPVDTKNKQKGRK